MSTLPGQASKVEKTKSKFQSLDINSLYRVSRGENPEKQQQKSSHTYIKHGMQSLGKVPNARRAPANLPSLKAEHSGTDAAVPLVPPGAPGWGKQESPQPQSGASPQQSQTQATSPSTQQGTGIQQPPQLSSHQAAIALPVTTTIPPQQQKTPTPTAQTVPANDKLWSAVMGGQDPPQPPLYQSPQFQHEFPSLSSGDGGPTRTGSDVPQYPSGLSLRPQTEGSWTQGGQRGGGPGIGGVDPVPRGQGLPSGGAPQLPAQVGLQQVQQQLPPQIRGVMPPFMCKGSTFQQQPPLVIQNNMNQPTQANGHRGQRPHDGRQPPPRLADHRDVETDTVAPRPIIKEEDLNRMDEIGQDMGWAESDDIDYNQTIAFSDDETDATGKMESRRQAQHGQKQYMQNQHHYAQNQQQMHGSQHQLQQNRDFNRDDRNDPQVADSQPQQRVWGGSRSSTSRGRSSEDEDTRIQQKRCQQDKDVELAVQRAKQRKEEEEKRFNEERKQGAAKKLLELEEKIQKRDRDNHEGVGTINPLTVPPKPINQVDIPLPDFQKEKERDRDSRSRTPNEVVLEDKNSTGNQSSNFRHLTQIEGKNFSRKKPSDNRDRERDRDREQSGPNFSRQFQSNLPPRFLKNQSNNSSSNSMQTNQQTYYQFDNNRWSGGSNQSTSPKQGVVQQSGSGRSNRVDSPGAEKDRHDEIEDERRDYKRQGSEDSYRSSHHSQQDLQKAIEPKFPEQDGRLDNRHQNFDSQYARTEREDDKWEKEKDHHLAVTGNDVDWNEKRDKLRDDKTYMQSNSIPERYDGGNIKEHQRNERPQRPDSRESRTSRHQRDDYPGWSDAASSSSYEDSRRRDDRRTVPGPITKDRIEADDDGRSDKRGLTQLKRGLAADVKIDSRKEESKIIEEKKEQIIDAWADSIPTPSHDTQPKFNEEKKIQEAYKPEAKAFNDQPRKSDEYNQHRNNRTYSQRKNWNSQPNDYHHHRSQTSWQKRSSSKGHRFNRDHHGTDSDASAEDHSADHKAEKLSPKDQKSPKPMRKLEKDDKNRENKQEKFSSEQKKSDNYVPKGEPSRHGRGGSTFNRGRMSSMNKRMDGYGPPPPKSSFGSYEEKEKKLSVEEPSLVSNTTQSSSEVTSSVDDKIKQSQQALAAGIIGKRNLEPAILPEDKNRSRNRIDSRKAKSKSRDEGGDLHSDQSDDKNKEIRKGPAKPVSQGLRAAQNSNRSRSNQPPRMGGEKRGNYENSRQSFNNQGKKDDKFTDQNTLVNAIADISLKSSDIEVEEKEEKVSVNGDTEGFQEVKSKKAVKERQKSAEEKVVPKSAPKPEVKDVQPKDREPRKPKSVVQQLTQQQIQNIPPLMATPVNPPPVPPINKTQFERPRQSKLAPRFAKQKMQKAAQMQHHGMCNDIGDMNKVGQNINMYVMKEANNAPSSVTGCAWDKPLGSQLRNMEHDNMLGSISIDNVKGLDTSQTGSQGTNPNNEKILGKSNQLQEKNLLDGTTPPINTIIFENTNFKSAPGSRNSRNEKPRSKVEDPNMDSSVMTGFNKQPSMNELLQTKNDSKTDPMQLPLFKEDNDMKLDFFTSDLQFADDKTKNLCIGKSLHAITSGNNTVDSLDIKIASVKKVWETTEQENEDNQISFGGPPLESNVFSQGKDTPDDNHEGYSPSPNQSASATTNVCKQVSATGQTVLSSAGHQQHSGIVAPGLMGNPLSPPPMAPVLSASVGIGPQQYTANQHMGYQASLSGNTQYGIPAIPSPPTVPIVYSQTQQLQAAQTASLYGAFQIDQTGVLGGQGRSQFSQYPNFAHHAAAAAAGLGQTASSPYTTHQSVYLQTAPPHPPPTAQPPPPPPDLYSNMSGYRLAAAAASPFAPSQQLSNPTTVLISSSSSSNNSLMSATVKGGSQAISAIGTKAGGIGQAYQQQPQSAQQQQQQQQQGQVYMTFDPSLQANYLAAAVATPGAAMQRGPAAPVQSNVAAGLQPSSSFYSGSTGQAGYFQQPGNSTMPSAQLQQHQAGFGLQGNVFSTHNQSHTNTGLQNFNSHFLATSMQVAAALNAQQFRSAYIKGVGNQQIGDQPGRPQQLKSPSSQEVLSSVFNSGPQIPSPKSRQNCKHPPPQSSPTAQQKYNMYPGVGQQNSNIQRYPTPIQRPVNFQQMQQNNSVNQKHKNNPNNNKTPNRQYYGGQNNSLSVQNDKTEEAKMNDNSLTSSANSASGGGKNSIGTTSSPNINAATEKVKDNIKEETAALKD